MVAVEVTVGITVTGWFVSPIVTRVINAGFDYLNDQIDVKEELDRLQDILPNIQAVVDFASSQTEISNQHLNKWLWQLRDAIDEADDVLDDFEYIKHQQQLTENKKKKEVPSNIFSSVMTEIGMFGQHVFKTDPNSTRLEEVVKKLDKISAGVVRFLYLLKKTKEEQQEQQHELYESRETGPLPQNDLIGRGYEKQYVMQWLMREPSNEEGQTTFYKNISLLSIVGHGGMGKTTLLQHVYEDVNKEEFPLKMWVCVSTNFDAKKVIADMLEYVTEGRPGVESLGKLQESLKSTVNSNKFLLVLDDIWEEEEEHRDKSKWEKVLAPLASGSFRSKILITTRMESVASMMAKVIRKKSETLKVEGLAEDECLQLLNAHAFAGVENPDHDHKKLRFIAGKMVKKLSGSPLAAKIMGGVLNSSLEERYWDNVLNSDIGNIMPILRLSYTFLSKHLQICFAFCAIFPQDHKFNKDDLVRMWIALGFIQPPNNGGETMEDIGGRYFDALVKKSFFDKFDDYFKMHDLLHELAQSVSKHECLRVEGDQELFSETPETIRHLFLKTRNQEELKKIEKFKNLRSLFLANYVGYVDISTEIFNATRSIRLLYIGARDLKMTPEAIGYLTHLRYLYVTYFTKIPEWPTSLCNLYHLQFIIWSCIKTNPTNYTFPAEMNNLSHLRYLKCPDYDISSIREIGKLTFLQKLGNFEVKNDPGYGIGELEQMNDLRELHIHSLHNVKDAQGACNAKLHDKRNLTKLSLKWDHSRDLIDIGSNDEKVLDNLQPPSCLKKLMIDKYVGSRSAIWMNTAVFISNLEIIKLTGCSNWQTIPPFGQLRFLKSLHLDSMPEVKQFDNKFHGNEERCVFPSLEMLYFSDLQALENWFDAKEVAAGHDMFPCLTELHLSNCPNLQELPYLPPKLKRLFIYNIGWETLNCCRISNLEKLDVSCCPNITNIPLARLVAPRLLEIKNCPKLISLGGHTEVETTENCQLILNSLFINHPSKLLMELLRSITSVKELEIMNNDEEECFLKVSSSLLQLNFASLQSLQSLPSALESLSSIETLSVRSIPELRELPNLPPSLAKLELQYLDNLDCLPSCLPTLSSLEELLIVGVPQLQELPNLPPSLATLHLRNLDNLDCLPSCLPSLSSLKHLRIMNIPQLRELPNLPPSLARLRLSTLDNLDCLPSCLPSLSSLTGLVISNVPRLRELQNLPPSLTILELKYLDNLDCFPSCLPTLSSLEELSIFGVPQLRELPNLPPSLVSLNLRNLDNLDCLPSCLPSLSSLDDLSIINIPQLRELPSFPPSLAKLELINLDNLDCFPSCLPSLSCLKTLEIMYIPRLQDLPDLPSSLKFLQIIRCHPDLIERYREDEGSDWHKISHIPWVYID